MSTPTQDQAQARAPSGGVASFAALSPSVTISPPMPASPAPVVTPEMVAASIAAGDALEQRLGKYCTRVGGSELLDKAFFDTPGAVFANLRVLEVANAAREMMYVGRRMQMAMQRPGMEYAALETSPVFHVPLDIETAAVIVEEGFKLSGTCGFFGRGYYFGTHPVKSNMYSQMKGSAVGVRVVLVCSVLTGVVKSYEIGHFERALVAAPKGVDSISGYLRGASEFVVYDASQIVVRQVVLYTFPNVAFELNHAPILKPPTSAQQSSSGGAMVFITASLSEFFDKIKTKAHSIGGDALQTSVKRMTGDLLRNLVTVDEFLARVGVALQAPPPADLAAKLKSEIAKCDLSAYIAASAAAAAAAVTAAAPAAVAAAAVAAAAVAAVLDSPPVVAMAATPSVSMPPSPETVYEDSDDEPLMARVRRMRRRVAKE